jgi:hypothetical protein
MQADGLLEAYNATRRQRSGYALAIQFMVLLEFVDVLQVGWNHHLGLPRHCIADCFDLFVICRLLD